MDMEQFKRGCLPGNLTEVEKNNAINEKRRKDLVELMLELEDIKNDYKRILEKKDRLANLMRFNNNFLAGENG